MRRKLRLVLCVATATALVVPVQSTVSAQGLNRYGNPATLKPSRTRPEISSGDLQTRLYIFAADSMQGRSTGRLGNKRGTDYIAAELRRLGLVPAGDNGTYFQTPPYHFRQFTDHSRLTVNGTPLAWNTDWVAVPGTRAPRPIADVEVVFGGTAGDTLNQITPAQASGKLVVLLPASPAPRPGAGPGGRPGGLATGPSRFAAAAAIATVDLDPLTTAQRVAINTPTVATISPIRRAPAAPANVTVDSLTLLRQMLDQLAPQASLRLTREAAARLFGRASIDGLRPGVTGGTVTASLDYIETPSDWARNVVALIPGSDPKLKYQYVAIGAHNDHVGITTPVDKDSLKAFNDARNRMLLANNMLALTPQQLASIRVNMDSIRQRHPVARLDSINNGADDDGSGSMAVLEIAEAIQAMQTKPKRSTLFVWHTGEESGLVGSYFFARNPTVPMDSIVAQINLDMVGRGRAEDIPGGGPDYLAVVGSFFDSKDLGETVTSVNKRLTKPLSLDYRFDSATTWAGYNNIYGRSDHFNYAQQGVPIAFFFTGLHGDYHQRTDEPEWIDYPHYARITSYIGDLVVEVGNGPRPRMNGTRPARPPRVVP
jgi:hypothetical protein